MPAAPVDGMNITISSTQQITALTINANTGQSIVGNATALKAGGAQVLIYRLSNTTWYNQGNNAAVVTNPQFSSQLFTASGTWTAPANTTQVRVIVIGAGGPSNTAIGGDGGVGGFAIAQCTVTGGTAYTVTVGLGRALDSGLSGGTSSFGSLVSATGGAVGASSPGASGTGTVSSGTAIRTGSPIQGNTYQAAISPFSPIATGFYASSAAVVWSASSTYMPGAQGSSGVGGSYGGIVYVQYVG
jgi:hypothetical protein